MLTEEYQKKNCCLLIKDTWEAKALYEASSKHGVKSTLDEFLYLYLKKRFGTQEIIAEWAYNLIEACKKHRPQNVICGLFLDILNGIYHEEVYHHQNAIIERLKNAFSRMDTLLNEGKTRGLVSKANSMEVLTQFWPEKSSKQLAQMKSALDADQPGDNLTYRWLFHKMKIVCCWISLGNRT